MRQVFSSPRIENVEGVAKLLGDAGIEVRVTDGRSYKGGIRGDFSYRDHDRKDPQPAVWIVRSEDQPQARAILRGAGLLATTRAQNDSFLSQTIHMREPAAGGDARRKRAFRLKLGLLLVIAVAIALALLAARKTHPALASRAPAVAAPAEDPGFVVATPPALAATLLRVELAAQAPALACVAIDGADAPDALLAGLRKPGRELLPVSACAARTPDVRFDVTGYRTDGSGTGTVRLQMVHRGTGKTSRAETRVLEVERTGDAWRVVRMR